MIKTFYKKKTKKKSPKKLDVVRAISVKFSEINKTLDLLLEKELGY